MHDIARTVGRINGFRYDILKKYLETPLFRHSLQDVKRVVIINSSSRSGSSLLYAMLSKLPDCYSLTGEAAPFYKLNTSTEGCNLYESDKIPTELLDTVIDYPGLSRDFFSDLFLPGTETVTKRIDAEAYIDELMLRLPLQWTDIDFEPSLLRARICEAFECYAEGHELFSTEDFYLVLLEHLSRQWLQINPFYYDIGTDKVALQFPFIDIPYGPPNSYLNIEEPPFILQPPRRRPTPADLSDKILFLKSTVDCYRMNLMERLFPDADIRIIHLVRNPAATINGIYDGWLHRGFFSHNLTQFFKGNSDLQGLRIRGYSDMSPFGESWWNFDLPEGWQGMADRDLIEVCAFQWHSANSEILRYLADNHRRSCTVHFEDIIRSIDSRTVAFERMLDFMGVPAEQASALQLNALPVVQSTLPPQLYRWKRRKDLIDKLLDDPKIVAMSEQLGYRTENMDEWL